MSQVCFVGQNNTTGYDSGISRWVLVRDVDAGKPPVAAPFVGDWLSVQCA